MLGSHDLAGLRFAVQGLGNVGLPLCSYLHERGAPRWSLADVDPARTAAAAAELRAEVAAPEAIYEQAVDVFAPCALGAVLNDRTIPRLRVRLVCGGANNQLAEARHDAMLAARGIAFVPDYLANAGGVIDFYQEAIDDSPAAVLASVERIRGITADVLAQAAATGETPLAGGRRDRARLTAAAAPLAGWHEGGDMATCGEVLVAAARGLRGRHRVRHPGRAHGRALSRPAGDPHPPRHPAPRAGCRVHGRRLCAGERQARRLLHHHRPGHDQHPDRHGPGLRRFGADAGDLERQPHRAAGDGPGAAARAALAAGDGGRGAAFSHTLLHPRTSCPRCWRGRSRCSPARGRGRCISRSRST